MTDDTDDDERLKRDEATVQRDFWRKLGGYRRANPVRRGIAHRLLLRLRPQHADLCARGADRRAAYFIAPFDLIPDVLPIVGLTDDAAVIAAAIKLVWDQIKPEHRDAAREALARMSKAAN